eukprot:356647-Chlamydomonas_euryale.AAC.8
MAVAVGAVPSGGVVCEGRRCGSACVAIVCTRRRLLVRGCSKRTSSVRSVAQQARLNPKSRMFDGASAKL